MRFFLLSEKLIYKQIEGNVSILFLLDPFLSLREEEAIDQDAMVLESKVFGLCVCASLAMFGNVVVY